MAGFAVAVVNGRDTIMMKGYGFADLFFFFKQKTAYEISVRDWSSDVCSSDLARASGTRSHESIVMRTSVPRGLTHVGRSHAGRSEERRVGKECDRLCRSRW